MSSADVRSGVEAKEVAATRGERSPRGGTHPGGTPIHKRIRAFAAAHRQASHLAKTSHVAKAEVKEQRIRVTRHGAKAGHVIRPGLSEAKRAPAWRSGAVSEDPGTVISSVWAPWCSQLASLRWRSWTQTRTPVSVAGDDDRLFL